MKSLVVDDYRANPNYLTTSEQEKKLQTFKRIQNGMAEYGMERDAGYYESVKEEIRDEYFIVGSEIRFLCFPAEEDLVLKSRFGLKWSESKTVISQPQSIRITPKPAR